MSSLVHRQLVPADRGPWARFDDLAAGHALRFQEACRIVVARTPAEVPAVLRAVQDETDGGAWAYGFVGYEAASGLDAALVTHLDRGETGTPPAWFAITDAPGELSPVRNPPPGPLPGWAPDWSDTKHAAAVQAVHEAIAAGETYQCNLTDRLRSTGLVDPDRLYATLAHAQRGHYNALLDTGDHVVVSASPELFFEWSDDILRTRPMKGTAPRGATLAEDRAAAELLRTTPKERAENLMIVDLLRNDLARVATIGTVAVTELFSLEQYPTVWQLTSEITARTRPRVDLLDIFRALFPCGSVTGAPKARTMELIRDLELGPRGVYCGAIGLVAPPGQGVRARFSVAIRTAVFDRSTGKAVYGPGGGITWDSRDVAERAELMIKAAVLSGAQRPRHADELAPARRGADHAIRAPRTR